MTQPAKRGAMKVSDMILVLSTPSCWIQLLQYSKAWDEELNNLMTTKKFIRVSKSSAIIGGREVWVENHPYASFSLESPPVRPARATMLRAWNKYVLDTINTPL